MGTLNMARVSKHVHHMYVLISKTLCMYFVTNSTTKLTKSRNIAPCLIFIVCTHTNITQVYKSVTS